MNVHIDTDRCQGHGRCVALAPELFASDDLGFGVVVGPGVVVDEGAARLAAENCPEQAITLGGE